MGREIKRVPLDFDWPLNKTWQGYLMPDELDLPTCQDCDGRGTTTAHEWVGAVAHLLLMVGEDAAGRRAGRDLHPYLGSLMNRPGGRPSPDAAELSTGLAGRAPSFIGHDAIDRWRATAAIIKAAGLPEKWGYCTTCDGNGEVATAEQKAAHEAWEKTQPPVGDGWQLWQTVSEGSPISPVFASPEELARWMSSPAYTWGAARPLAYDVALKFVNDGWAPSFVSGPDTGLISGVEFIGSTPVTGGDTAAITAVTSADKGDKEGPH